MPRNTPWEKAARGGIEIPKTAVVLPISAISETPPDAELKENPNQARQCPYDDKPDPERMNIEKTDISATSAVGCFSTGKSPYGCEEMCGNVWEWLRNLYDDGPQTLADEQEYFKKVKNSISMSIRGGSWYHDDSRCGFRGRDLPYSQDRNGGFRLLLRAPFSSTSGL